MIKPSRKPYGYRELLVYKKAEQLQLNCATLTHRFPRTKTLIALADQMDRSARSVKQNIVEGWKRNSSQEYYDFLGFSMGANSELEEDCDDIWKGMYPELMGLRGITGERGENNERGKIRGRGIQTGGRGRMGITGEIERQQEIDIEKLSFYPIEPSLPSVVKLKLQCKELNFLFDRLQKSLLEKMTEEKTLSRKDKNFLIHGKLQKQEQRGKDFEEVTLRQFGLKKLPNGQVVKENGF